MLYIAKKQKGNDMANTKIQLRSPSIGYSSEAKEKYRKDVWDSIIDQIGTHGNFLILPSKDGEEIDYLIDRGIPQSRIICIDENPALIASASWRKKYSSIRAYGVKVSDVAARLKKAKIESISAANLDLCNNFSEELVQEVGKFLLTAPLAEDFCFSVTVSKGREQSVTNYLMNLLMQSNSWSNSEYSKLQEKRISCLMRILSQQLPSHWLVKLAGEGSYIHHKTPMAWASFRIINTKKHYLVNKMMDKAKFEFELYKRCGFYIDGYQRNRGQLKSLITSQDITTIKERHPEFYQSMLELLSSDYNLELSKAKMIAQEHKEIMDIYHSLTKDSLDWNKQFCPILYQLYLVGVSQSQIEKLDEVAEWFDNAKQLFV